MLIQREYPQSALCVVYTEQPVMVPSRYGRNRLDMSLGSTEIVPFF